MKGSINEENMDFKPDFVQIVNNHEDKTMFSDDTGIAFKNPKDIINKLTIYDQITQKNRLLVNWDKVFILIPKSNKEIPNIINTLPHPYNKIKCTNKGKILGHMMEPDKKMNIAVSEGIRKAKIAWQITRNKINKYTDSDNKLKIILLDSLVGSVLLYSLHIIPLHHTLTEKLQTFYS